MQNAFNEIIERLEDEIDAIRYDDARVVLGIRKAIEIITKVAEEYKSTEHINCSSDTSIDSSTEEICEWKSIWINARVKYSNCEFEIDNIDMSRFNYCPYCGKRIKIITD